MSIQIAETLGSITNGVLQSLMPPSVRASQIIIRGESVVVVGTLPSGSHWEVPLDIDLREAYYDTSDTWYASTELARELHKAADAFKAMCALEGDKIALEAPRPGEPFMRYIREDYHVVTAGLCIIVPEGAERIRTKLLDTRRGLFVNSVVDLSECSNTVLPGAYSCEVNLRGDSRYILAKLEAMFSTGESSTWNGYQFGTVSIQT